MRIGILGVGSLAEYLVRGAPDVAFLLSPRSADRAARLGWPIAASNQEVVSDCDYLLVCLPAGTGLKVLQSLRFRPGQTVLSAMAGVSQPALAQAVFPAKAHVTMMPGYANQYGVGPSILYPPDPMWSDFLSRLGPVHQMKSQEEFDLAAVFGAMSGASFVFLQTLADWFSARGLDPDLSRRLVAETLRGNAEVLLQSQSTLEDVVKGVATPGGITEQLVAGLDGKGALQAWQDGMDAVFKRMRGE